MCKCNECDRKILSMYVKDYIVIKKAISLLKE